MEPTQGEQTTGGDKKSHSRAVKAMQVGSLLVSALWGTEEGLAREAPASRPLPAARGPADDLLKWNTLRPSPDQSGGLRDPSSSLGELAWAQEAASPSPAASEAQSPAPVVSKFRVTAEYAVGAEGAAVLSGSESIAELAPGSLLRVLEVKGDKLLCNLPDGSIRPAGWVRAADLVFDDWTAQTMKTLQSAGEKEDSSFAPTIKGAELKLLAGKRIETLSLRLTATADLAPLAKVEGLWKLSISAKEQLGDRLDSLAKLKNLRMLSFDGFEGRHIQRHIKGLDKLTTLEWVVSDRGVRVYSDNMAELMAVPQLERLTLPIEAVVELRYLKEHPGLRELTLCDAGRRHEWRDLKGLASLRGLTKLELRGVQWGDSDFAFLPQLSQCECLTITDSQASDPVLSFVARIPAIRALTIQSPNVTIIGLAELTRLPRLKVLRLIDVGLGDKELQLVSQLRQLEALEIHVQPGIKAASMYHLTKLANLRSLSVYVAPTKVPARGPAGPPPERALMRAPVRAPEGPPPAPLGNAAVLPLKNLSNLEELRLCGFALTGKGVGEFARLERLIRLNLTAAALSAKDFSGLAELKNLRELVLRAPMAGRNDLIDLRSALPGCTVYWTVVPKAGMHGTQPAAEPGPKPQPYETWTDASGRFQITARYLGLDPSGRMVRLGKQDGTEISVRIEKLSAEDRNYLRNVLPLRQ